MNQMTGKSSIRKRVIAIVVLLSVCPIVLLGGFLIWRDFTVQKQAALEMQKKLTLLVSNEVRSTVHEQVELMRALVRYTRFMDMRRDEQYLLLSKYLFSSGDKQHHGILTSLELLDGKGTLLMDISRDSTMAPAGQQKRSEAEEFDMPARSRETYYGPVYVHEQTGEPLMKLSIPIVDMRSLDVRGVLVATINLKFMQDTLGNIQVGETGIAYVLSESGRVILHPNPSVVLRGTYFKIPERPDFIMGLQGKQSLIATDYVQFGSRTFTVVTELPVREALKYTVQSLSTIGLFLAATLVGAIILGFTLLRQIIQPIEALSGVAVAISKGDFSQKMVMAKNDEIGDLAHVLNGMTTRLIDTIRFLENEIEERKQADRKILVQNELMNNILDSLTHPFYVIDADSYVIKLANKAAHFGTLTEKSTCYSLTHKRETPCAGVEHPCTISEVMRTKAPVVLEHMHYNTSWEPGFFNVYGYPIFDSDGNIRQVIEYTIDVTERKKLEKQFLQAQKMEAIGHLAGGIAHDFNNLLSAIMGYSEIVLSDLPAGHPVREKVMIIRDAGDKAATLTRQLLAFSRKQILEIKVVNINTIVENMTRILQRVIGENVQLEINARPEVRDMKADAGQIEQVLMNLAVNARDAMPDGGRITIETDNIALDEEYARTHEGVRPGDYVMLAVSDSGTGMSRDIQEKIFDPFFSTKGERGTGLGLSTTYGIVKQHGGHIYVYSELHVGTTFKIYLPATTETREGKDRAQKEIELKGEETILIVDDEPSILKLMTDILQPLGYRLLEASGGKEAQEVSKAAKTEIDVLITDVIMPDMTGIELAKSIRETRPSITVIYMSGYTDTAILHGILDKNMNFLQKPLTPKKLRDTLRKALAERNEASP